MLREQDEAVLRPLGLTGRDCEDIHKWGGTDSDWTNATHVNRANMRRMLRYVVAHSGGAL